MTSFASWLRSSAMRVSSRSRLSSSTSRIGLSMFSSVVWRRAHRVFIARFPVRQDEAEGRALAHRALCPDRPAVALDDPLHVGQADARAFEFLGLVQPLEHAEQLVDVLHLEAHAVILDLQPAAQV